MFLRKAAVMGACVALACSVVGCSRNQNKFNAPPVFHESEGVLRRLDPATQSEAFAQVFPHIESLHIAEGRIQLQPPVLRRDYFTFAYYAGDAENVRMLMRDLNNEYLDIIARSGFLTVIQHETGGMYQGDLSEQASPLIARYGWTPEDFYSILTIGQTLRDGRVTAEDESGEVLVPVEDFGDGLEWVELGTRTGLPARARWTSEGRTWTASYREWENYWIEENGIERSYLMPCRVEVEYDNRDAGAPASTVQLLVDSYIFSETPPEGIFRAVVNYKLIMIEEDQLDEILY